MEKFIKISIECYRKFEGNELSKVFKENIDYFQNIISVIMSLCDPALETQHWDEIHRILSKD